MCQPRTKWHIEKADLEDCFESPAVGTQDVIRQNSKNTGIKTECESLFATDVLA